MLNNKAKNIYYLGPDGSNSHNALLKFIDFKFLKIENVFPQKTIKSVLDAISNDKNSLAVLPIENSIEGIVRETIDNILKLKDDKIKIQAELTIPIKHLLLSTGKDKTKLIKIISHPQALSQCGKYLHKNYKDAFLQEVSSTSYAAQKISEEKNDTFAALANEACAKIFNLNILEDDINDEKDNKTRFYVLSRFGLVNKKTGKTAIILSTKNKPGALCDVLKVFAQHDINLTYIDSRPSKKRLGEYLFFMELDCPETDIKVIEAVKKLQKYVNFIKILGSFIILN